MFGSSLLPVVCWNAHVLATLFVFACIQWCPTISIGFFLDFLFFLCTSCQFLWIVPFGFPLAVFSKVYSITKLLQIGRCSTSDEQQFSNFHHDNKLRDNEQWHWETTYGRKEKVEQVYLITGRQRPLQKNVFHWFIWAFSITCCSHLLLSFSYSKFSPVKLLNYVEIKFDTDDH